MAQNIVDEIFLDINHTGQNCVWTKIMWTKNCWTNGFWTKWHWTKCYWTKCVWTNSTTPFPTCWLQYVKNSTPQIQSTICMRSCKNKNSNMNKINILIDFGMRISKYAQLRSKCDWWWKVFDEKFIKVTALSSDTDVSITTPTSPIKFTCYSSHKLKFKLCFQCRIFKGALDYIWKFSFWLNFIYQEKNYS